MRVMDVYRHRARFGERTSAQRSSARHEVLLLTASKRVLSSAVHTLYSAMKAFAFVLFSLSSPFKVTAMPAGNGFRINAIDRDAVGFGDDPTKDFHPIDLPGDDYVAGPKLFPELVVADYFANYTDFKADAWAQHVLEDCKANYPECSVTSSFSGE
jgi:hypothetical protein